MKGNKMSAILAILLMLGGALFMPHAFSFGGPSPGIESTVYVSANAAPGGATIYPLNVSTPSVHPNVTYAYGTWTPGMHFTVYFDVYNITNLAGGQIGFTFNTTYLQLNSVEYGNFIVTSAAYALTFPGDISSSNSTGIVPAWGWAIKGTSYSTKVSNGSGPVLEADFCINPAIPANYTGSYPGTPVQMMDIITSGASILTLDEVIPALSTGTLYSVAPTAAPYVQNGFFSLTVTPHGPTAALVVSPNPAVNGTSVEFDASGSSPASNGYAPVAITKYYFSYGDGTSNTTISPVTYHYYVVYGPTPPLPTTYTVNVTVSAVVNLVTYTNTCANQILTLEAKPVFKPTITATPTLEDLSYPTYGPGYEFSANVSVNYASLLMGFQVGFTFNPAYLQVLNVSYSSFLYSNGATSGTTLFFPGSINNTLGLVTAYGEIMEYKANAVTGNGTLLTVWFEINPALWPPYTGVYPGTPVPMMQFSLTEPDIQAILVNTTAGGPPGGGIVSGYFNLYVTPTPPMAIVGITPFPPTYVGTLQSFFGGASVPGTTGYGPSSIALYEWTITHTPTILENFTFSTSITTPSTFWYYTLPYPGTYSVTLKVVDAAPDSLPSAPVTVSDVILPIPAGCSIDLTSQNWRYIDPTWLYNVPNGAGYNSSCTLFRPGDYVQLFADTTYNLDPVANQLVSFEVLDNNGNVVLTGTAITNASGIAEYDFRIPWPATNVQGEFGIWTAVASWQCGALLGEAPYERTQVDTMGFQVGWGLWITSITLSGVTFAKGTSVTVKINVENDYQVPVPALATVTLYDDLSVPIGTTSVATIFYPTFPHVYTITFSAIVIPTWAFAGTHCAAKADLFTTWPADGGTSFCPEVTNLPGTFIIK